MKSSFKPVLLTCVISALLCNACGFHIATKHNLGEKYANLVIQGNQHDPFFIELESQLVLNGVNVLYSKNSISYYNSIYLPVLSCGSMSGSQATVAVGSNSQDLEYTMRSQVTCQLFTPSHKPYRIKTSINRAVVSTPGSNLASDSKNSLLMKENATELAHEIIDRMHGSYLSIEQMRPVTIDNEADAFAGEIKPLGDEHVRVVFNATQGDAPQEATIVKDENAAQAIIDKRKEADRGDAELIEIDPEAAAAAGGASSGNKDVTSFGD